MSKCFDQNFDHKKISYDLEKFNLPEWALSIIKEKYPQVDSLDNLHNTLTTTEIVDASSIVQKKCESEEFVGLIDGIIEENIKPFFPHKELMIQRFGTMRVVVPQQEKKGRLLNFHTGIFNGNGWGLRTVWTPLTEAFDTNTMWVVPWEKSQEISKRSIKEQWDYDTIQDENAKYAFPVNISPGQSHLFTQGHWHGNFNNETNKTRVSIDMRILVEGEQFHRKLPGGYFRFLGDNPNNKIIDNSNKEFITYAGWNSTYSKYIPLPLQRRQIDEYCELNNIKYNDYQFELEFMDWLPNFEKFIKSRKQDGIVLMSIWSLPDDEQRRDELLQIAFDNKVELHFANENLVLKNENDLNYIKKVLSFSKDTSSPKF